MPQRPQKLILIGSGRYDYAEVELEGTLQIVGPNNTGKTTLINTLQFLYLDDRRKMDFGSYSPEQTRDYYFPNQYSYILFQCLGARGQCVLGWRGQSPAAGGDPERFFYEGPFDPDDFFDESNRVREPKDVTARLAIRQFTLLKNAGDHREFLQQATRGEAHGMGLVVLRDNNKYPHFRETLKDLLTLNSITQDQMRERLLMLANIPPTKIALDVRDLFGADYDKILDRRQKIVQFKENEGKVRSLVTACSERNQLQGEMIFRWSDLKAKRTAFEEHYKEKIEKLVTDADAAHTRSRELNAQLEETRQNEKALSEKKGSLSGRIHQIKEKEAELRDFVEDLARTGLKTLDDEIRRLENQLDEADRTSPETVTAKLEHFSKLVADKKSTVTHFDRALVNVLRQDLSDEELDPLARIFNGALLGKPVGPQGIQILKPKEFVQRLRKLGQQVDQGVYRDSQVEIPLSDLPSTLTQYADLDTVKQELAEHEATLERWQGIRDAVQQREELKSQRSAKKNDADQLRKNLFDWEKLQKDKEQKKHLETQLKETTHELDVLDNAIDKLQDRLQQEAAKKQNAENTRRNDEEQFKMVMGRFTDCQFPDFEAKEVNPDEAIPDDFDAAIAVYAKRQKRLRDLDTRIERELIEVTYALGEQFVTSHETETIQRLREELEALPDREEALRRDWEHHLHECRATFDQVLRQLDDIQSAKNQLNRALSKIRVSNLTELHMEVLEHTDIVGALRRLLNIEQPGLFDDSAPLESTVDSFRKKFEANPLLNYTDLFTLRFDVTGDDGRVHRYDNFRQIESHGTTITIKVLFNLLVLRSLLREDASKSLHCEIPFFLDEIHSLDARNRRAILQTARSLGFIAITAAPEPVSEVDALYFLQAQNGRIVLQRRHRIGVTLKTES